MDLAKKVFRKKIRTPSCSKHGPYKGPYCPKCYERAMEVVSPDTSQE